MSRTATNRSGNSTSTWTISAASKQVIANSANSTKPVVYGVLKDLAKLTNVLLAGLPCQHLFICGIGKSIGLA